MKRNTSSLFLTAFVILLSSTSAVAKTSPAGSATKPLQFTAGGQIVAFSSRDLYVASGSHALRIEFVGAHEVSPIATGPTGPEGKAAPLDRVTYPGIWSGITLAYDAPSGQLRSTYTIAPGADPAMIRLRYNAPVAVDPGGELRIAFTSGAMRESAPVAWQDVKGRRVPVAVAFRIASEKEMGFALGPYDETRPLVIDPTLTWHVLLGGAFIDIASGIAVDASGNVYVTGQSGGTWGDPIRALTGGSDAFVAKLDTNGDLAWNTFLGGASFDSGNGIAVDASSNIYVTGTSGVTWGAPIRPFSADSEAFVAKLDTNGALVWNTFLGGAGLPWAQLPGNDYGNAIAVDANGNSYVTGASVGEWGAPIDLGSGGDNAFVAKLDTNGILGWNTFLGGKGNGIAVDAGGNVYVVGTSSSFVGLSPIRAFAGASDAFVAKFGTNGARLWYTFLGGASYDSGIGIAVDASANVYVTGDSGETWGTPVRPFGRLRDGFMAKLGTNGALLWVTFGGAFLEYDNSLGVAVDAGGGAYFTGRSAGPWGAPIYPWEVGNDACITKLDTNGVLVWNAFRGAGSYYGVAVDATGNAYAVGSTPNNDFPSSEDAFVAKLENYTLRRAGNDFDSDGRSDIGCYYSPGGNWYGFNSGNGFWETQFGYAGTVPVVVDFDDDGVSDIGVYHPDSGNWYFMMSTAGYLDGQFGYAGTIPVAGDFDGDGLSDIGVYHPPSGNWHVLMSTAGYGETQFGYAGTIPVVGDYDGDGMSDIGVYYPPGGNWYVFKSTEGVWQTQFGYAGTIPVVGDYDGDGMSDIGVYYPPGGNWYVFKSTEGFWQTQFGYAGTIPVVGDYDGDGMSDIGVYYPPGGNWYVFKSTEGFWQTQFGYEGTIPFGGTLR